VVGEGLAGTISGTRGRVGRVGRGWSCGVPALCSGRGGAGVGALGFDAVEQPDRAMSKRQPAMARRGWYVAVQSNDDLCWLRPSGCCWRVLPNLALGDQGRRHRPDGLPLRSRPPAGEHDNGALIHEPTLASAPPPEAGPHTPGDHLAPRARERRGVGAVLRRQGVTSSTSGVVAWGRCCRTGGWGLDRAL
jgi:hypothetical protein